MPVGGQARNFKVDGRVSRGIAAADAKLPWVRQSAGLRLLARVGVTRRHVDGCQQFTSFEVLQHQWPVILLAAKRPQFQAGTELAGKERTNTDGTSAVNVVVLYGSRGGRNVSGYPEGRPCAISKTARSSERLAQVFEQDRAAFGVRNGRVRVIVIRGQPNGVGDVLVGGMRDELLELHAAVIPQRVPADVVLAG